MTAVQPYTRIYAGEVLATALFKEDEQKWPVWATVSVNLRVPAGKVASTLTGFVVRVNLADMSTAWWDACDASGGSDGIRVKAAGTALPIDVVTADTGSRTGELFFRAPTLTTGNNDFTIESVFAGSAPLPTDPTGRDAVWDDYDLVVHFADWVDRTGAGHDPTEVGALVAYYARTQEFSTSLFQQGVAWDGSDWFGTGGANNKRIARYDGTTETEEVAVADASVAAVTGGGTGFGHISGCVVHDGELFVCADNYPDTGNQKVQVWSLSTLAFLREYDLEATRPNDQNSDICWNSDDAMFVMPDYGNPNVLHTWDEDFTFLGNLTLPTPIGQIQGIEWSGGYYFLMTGPQSTPSSLYRVADDMSGVRLGMWSGSAHNQGLCSKVHNTATPDLWYGDTTGDLQKLTYSTPSVTPEVGWLTVTGAGHALVTSLPKRTQWVMGATARIAQVPGSNYALLSYSDNSSSQTNRQTLAARDAPDQWGSWNSSNTWLSGTSITSGDVGQRRRLHHVQNATASRTMYLNGVSNATSATASQRPAGGSDGTMALFIGSEDADGSERWRGSIGGIVYLRNGVLSADWLAAEQLSWEGSAFYTIT